MTLVRLREPYGFLPINSNVELSPTVAETLLRERRADTNTAAGAAYSPPLEDRWQTPVSLNIQDGRDALVADLREIAIATGNASAFLPARIAAATVADPRVDFQALNYVLQQVLTNGPGLINKTPPKTAPYPITSTPYFLDQAAAGGGNGLTPATAFNSYAQFDAVIGAGKGLLLKLGTVLNLGGLQIPGTNGTSTAPIAIGVYDPSKGVRVSGLGLATISLAGSNNAVFYMNNKSWWCFDSIKFVGTLNLGSGTNGYIVQDGTSSNNQYINCDFSNSASCGIYIGSSGLGNVVEGCKMNNCATWGAIHAVTANASNTKFSFNTLSGNVNGGINVSDAGAGYTYEGLIVGNTVSNSTSASGVAGITVSTMGGACKFVANTISKTKIGIYITTSSTTLAADFGDSITEGNVITNSGWFGIERVGNKAGIGKVWIDQYNIIDRTGSYDNLTPADPTVKYGRAVEYYGFDAGRSTSGGVCRYNALLRSFNFIENFSEGIGVGFDDFSRSIDAHSNYIWGCQGSGIQFNVTLGGNRAYSNILVDNLQLPSGTYPGRSAADILLIESPTTSIFNNTSVLLGRSEQKYHIAEGAQYPSPGSFARNNHLIGGLRGGIVLSQMTESSNLMEGVGGDLVTNDATGALVNPGAGTEFVIAGSTGSLTPFYAPNVGSAADGRGATIDPGAVSFTGAPMGLAVPIGAQFAAY